MHSIENIATNDIIGRCSNKREIATIDSFLSSRATSIICTCACKASLLCDQYISLLLGGSRASDGRDIAGMDFMTSHINIAILNSNANYSIKLTYGFDGDDFMF